MNGPTAAKKIDQKLYSGMEKCVSFGGKNGCGLGNRSEHGNRDSGLGKQIRSYENRLVAEKRTRSWENGEKLLIKQILCSKIKKTG
jgi:hypothetical protein